MTDSPPVETTGDTLRVVVVVDMHSQLVPPLEVAVAMATAHRAGLCGMCIEDPGLRQTAGLPFSQEVMLLGGRTRRLEDQQLRRSLERFQTRFRALLSEHAERHAIPWTVSTISGQGQVLTRDGLTKSDLVVLGKPGQSLAAGPAPARILVLATDGAAVLPTLKVLLSLNGGRQTEVIVVQNSASGNATTTQLADELTGTTVRSLDATDAAQRRVINALRLQYVVAAQDSDKETLNRILPWVSCPVILAN